MQRKMRYRRNLQRMFLICSLGTLRAVSLTEQ